MDNKRDCKLGFGEFVHVYADFQGTYLFMSLLTWKTIKRRKWAEMLLPGEIIYFINCKALSSTSILLDVEIRLGDKIIEDRLTYMDQVGVTEPVDEDINETIPEKLKNN